MFGGLTHAPAIRLAERLVAMAPPTLDKVFLADSGSVSVEVALKMALQHQRGRRPSGTHPDAHGARRLSRRHVRRMSVCDPHGGMHSMFADALPAQVFADRPPAPGGDVDSWAEGFRDVAAAHSHDVAAIMVEPVLQGAGGMHVYDAECLRVMRSVADEHGFLLVLDEIATGFGRTGTMFASEAAGVAPDIMCVGKALTGGYLTLAAVLCTREVAAGLSASESGVLMHGPTYMGNPLACAVALANLDLLATGDWRVEVARIGDRLDAGLTPCGADRRRRRAHGRRRRGGPARPPGRRRQGHRRRTRARRVAPTVP